MRKLNVGNAHCYLPPERTFSRNKYIYANQNRNDLNVAIAINRHPRNVIIIRNIYATVFNQILTRNGIRKSLQIVYNVIAGKLQIFRLISQVNNEIVATV